MSKFSKNFYGENAEWFLWKQIIQIMYYYHDYSTIVTVVYYWSADVDDIRLYLFISWSIRNGGWWGRQWCMGGLEEIIGNNIIVMIISN